MKRSFLFKKINPVSSFVEMLIFFLAISLGFIVENYREDYLEQKNSEKLVAALLTDLRGDLIRFEKFAENRKSLINDIYIFTDDVEKRGLINKNRDQQIYFAKAIFNWTYFKPNIANIEQIISSGALRYLGNDELIHQIGILEASNNLLIDRQEREEEFFLNYLQPLMHKYYNFKWLNENYVRKWNSDVEAFSKIEIDPTYQKDYMFWGEDENLERQIINLFENYVFILRSSFLVVYDDYLNEINKTIEIIESENYEALN